ncbi:Uncharacterised protein [Mycobacteroides abscessus subsp. abscessus]|nr:Uncharacterised protein [Mycobacteroides abscessus subsp. abscessus]
MLCRLRWLDQPSTIDGGTASPPTATPARSGSAAGSMVDNTVGVRNV